MRDDKFSMVRNLMAEPSAAPRKGRPQKFPGQGARLPHAVRLKPAIADRLKTEAAANGRSVGEELELRIDRSFLGDSPAANFNGMDMNYVVAHIDSKIGGIVAKINSLAAYNQLYLNKTLESLFQTFEDVALEVKSIVMMKLCLLEAQNSTLTEGDLPIYNDPRIDELRPISNKIESIHHRIAGARIEAQVEQQKIAASINKNT